MVCVSGRPSRVKLVLQVLERLQTGISCCSGRHCNRRAVLKGVEISQKGAGSCQAAGRRSECPLHAVLQCSKESVLTG